MITHVKFVGIPVADQERALKFYTEKLGFEVLTDSPLGSQRWIELQCGRSQTGVVLFTPEGHEDRVWDVSVAPDGKRLLSASSDKTVRLWDVATGAEIRVYEGHTDEVRSARFSPDGRWAISACHDRTLKLWALP